MNAPKISASPTTRAARVQQEREADERDDEAFLDERRAQRVDRAVDQLRAVVHGAQGHAGRQSRANARHSFLQVADHVEREDEPGAGGRGRGSGAGEEEEEHRRRLTSAGRFGPR